MRLAGKTVLVTGGARGLGRAFAEAARGAGAEVLIADVLPAVHDTARAIGARGFTVDLSSPASIDECVRGIGTLDGLVNNAAVTNSGGRTLEELDVETWDRVMDVNVRGTWLVTRACLPLLRRSRGRIVNIASDTALWGAPRLLAYLASKGALIAMTRGMARELGPAGITVNAIAPGLTEVEATEYVPAERHRHYLQGRAIGRAQQPADVCGAVLFLLSDDAAFVTGQVLPVNGGFVMN
ncbi:MAG TPA: SDR family oxidoreductase [Burkholderiales bacterium]|nr:SDR family oxidoreductase [Burkholderiales bacterium]